MQELSGLSNFWRREGDPVKDQFCCSATTPHWTAIDDDERLAVLRLYGVLDTPAEPVYDRIADILRQGCAVEWAAVTLVDRQRQWFKAHRGFAMTETPREISFCSVCMQSDDLLLVDDALNDPRFRERPLMAGGRRVRFYAGCPLFSWEGFGLGAVCVMGFEPRSLTRSAAGPCAHRGRMRAGAPGDAAPGVGGRHRMDGRRGKALLRPAAHGGAEADRSGMAGV